MTTGKTKIFSISASPRKRGSRLILAGMAVISCLAACAIAPRDTGSAFMFDLPAARMRAAPAPSGETLTVAMPQTAAELDTYRIALKRDNRRWDYYDGARWSDFLPVVVRDDLTTTLAMAHIFKGVATDSSGLAGDNILQTDIQAFHAEYATADAPPVVKVRIIAHMTGRLGGTEIPAFAAEARRKAADNTLSAIQAAFAAAFRDAERQIARKIIEREKNHK